MSRIAVPDERDWESPPWGEDAAFRRPWMLVSVLRVWHGNQVLDVPRSAFADLSDVAEASIAAVPGGCIVVLKGGDAGTAWDAHVTIIGDRVTERHVQIGEFPDTYETTEYVLGTPSPGE